MIQYDLPRGSHSVGSHVRDAACYVCWAFARAYAPTILRPYVQELSKAIVIASLFDREINCRRAASASFQECVRRQGADNFKHGISILTTADYFTLGNRMEACTNVAKKIAVFEEYRHSIIDHLCDEKLYHWDVEIRKLSALSLRMLTPLEPGYFSQTVLPNLIPLCTHENLSVRHGAIIGVAEIVLALGSVGDSVGDCDELKNEHKNEQDNNSVSHFSDELMTVLADVVPQIEKARLYRGRGGEKVRAAASRYIECLSKAKIHLSVKQQVGLLDSLDVNLKHPNEDIQKAAVAALCALMNSYFPVGPKGPSERLQSRVVNNYIKLVKEEENPAATRGFVLALGCLPAKLVAHSTEVLDAVIDCFSYASNPETKVGHQGDAETRRNAVESLVRLCETVNIGVKSEGSNNGAEPEQYEYPTVGMNKKQVQKVFNCLLLSMEDYNTDRRGDVGSWSRTAAMKGLVTVTLLAVKASNIPQGGRSKPSLHTTAQTTTNENQNIDNTNDNDNYNKRVTIPSFNMRIESSFETNVQNKIEYCLENNKPYRSFEKTTMLSNIYFDDQVCAKVIGAILKQLAEKLDAVRCQAGLCLEQLLKGENIIPFVPRKEMLLEGLEMMDGTCEYSYSNKVILTSSSNETNTDKNKENDQNNNDVSEINWASPEYTFPLLMKVMNIDAFFHPIISGLVISVGGLTESVTKHSTKSFLDYFRALQKGNLIVRISKIGKALISLFDEHSKDSRVILPLLVTVDKLLSHGCLDTLLQDDRSDFSTQLVSRIRKESSRCTDIKRLMAIVPVALGVLHSTDKTLVHGTVLPFIMRLLAHGYPRVRRCVAEQLYVKLLEDDTIVPMSNQNDNNNNVNANVDKAITILSNVMWDRELGPPGNVRTSRNEIVDLLGIELSEKDRVGPPPKKVSRSVVDEFASYQSLVETAGR